MPTVVSGALVGDVLVSSIAVLEDEDVSADDDEGPSSSPPPPPLHAPTHGATHSPIAHTIRHR